MPKPNDGFSSAEKAYMIANKFFQENNIICFNDTFYYFKDGTFRIEDTRNTYAWIGKEYMNRWITPITGNQSREVARLIQDITYNEYRKQIKRMDEQKGNFINIKSGIMNLDTLEVKPYTKEDFQFHKLPFDYIEKPSCPVFAKFLTTSMNFEWGAPADKEDYNKVMHFVQEWMGYSMIPGNPYHKALILYGGGRNGKGVLMDIWSYILGSHNVSSVDIKGINDGDTIFMTKNKLVNFAGDIQTGQQLDTGVIKSAVAGEKVVVNEKYKAQYDMNFTAKLVIACNDLPYIKSVGAAIKERFFILPFVRIFEEHERDPYLKDKLKGDEAAHIFSWAINGLKRLMERGRFDPPERCHISSADYLKNHDTIAMWMDDDDLSKKGERAKRAEVWKHYKDYCKDSNLYILPKYKFFEKLQSMGHVPLRLGGTFYVEDLKLPNQTIL